MTIFSSFPLIAVTLISFMLSPQFCPFMNRFHLLPNHLQEFHEVDLASGELWTEPCCFDFLWLDWILSHCNLGFLEVLLSYQVPLSLPWPWSVEDHEELYGRDAECYLFVFLCLCSCISHSAGHSLTVPGPSATGSFSSSWAPAGAKFSVFHEKIALKSNPEKTEYDSLFCPAQWLPILSNFQPRNIELTFKCTPRLPWDGLA